MPPPLVWLVDSHVQIFRAYYSMPSLEGPDGREVGAARGYLNQLVRFLTRQEPTHAAVCWDHSLTSFRNELYEGYKRGRTEPPEDLAHQFELCARATRALGLPLFELEKFEADDVIATLVTRLLEQGARIAIVSSDKDLGSLVSEQVSLFDLKREAHSGPAEVTEKLGVPPALVPDLLSLAGDAVDCIPGVEGIGAKTAARLLNHFGSLERIPERFEDWEGLELRGARRAHERLQSQADRLALSRRLVAMRRDLPFQPSLDDLRYRGANRAALEALVQEIGGQPVLERVPRYRG